MSEAHTIEKPDLSAFVPELPRAVREAAERADAKLKEIADETAAKTTTVVTDPPVVVPPAAAPVVTPVAAPVVTPPEENWEQRYRTLQGKYDAEIPSLTNRLAELERARTTAPVVTPPAPVVAPPRVEIPPADVEAYGQDLIDAARRWVAPELADLTARLNRFEIQVAETRGNVATIKAQTAQDRVDAHIDADPVLGPTWRVTNSSPHFNAWLSLTDPASGIRRHDLLTQAYADGNAQRTAHFFRAYSLEHTDAAIPPVVAPTPAPVVPALAEAPTLADLAVPGRGTAAPAAPGAQTEKRMWSQADITAFYRDVQRKVYVGREAEQAEIERDIVAAPMEGRFIVKK